MNKSPFDGIGLIVDDKVFSTDTEDKIRDIVSAMNAKNVTYIPYAEIPSDDIIDNLNGLSFALIDWTLYDDDDGSSDSQEVLEAGVIDLINKLHSKYFIPIFVFSHQNEDDIKQCLTDAKIEVDTPGCFVMVREKSTLCNVDEQSGEMSLFKAVDEWIAKSPSLYVLTRWNCVIRNAQAMMFRDLYKNNHKWPIAFVRAYISDGDDHNAELASLLSHNLFGRLESLNLDKDVFQSGGFEELRPEEVKSIYKMSMLLPLNCSLVDKDMHLRMGDILRGTRGDDMSKTGEGDKVYYLLNISCDCDCVPGRDTEVRACFLEGNHINPSNETWDKSKHKLKQNVQSSYDLYPGIDENAILRFKFKTMHHYTHEELEALNLERVARLLPPYITDVRQRNAAWLMREGYPKPPFSIDPQVAISQRPSALCT